MRKERPPAGADRSGAVTGMPAGAALGLVCNLLESRTNPWWPARNQVEAERVAARRAQTLGSAPALWVLTVLIALIIPPAVAS